MLNYINKFCKKVFTLQFVIPNAVDNVNEFNTNVEYYQNYFYSDIRLWSHRGLVVMEKYII